MKCVAVTPEKTFIDQDVIFVVVPLYDGEFGIGNNHAPTVGRIGAGEMRLTFEDGSTANWYVEGGFVEIANNTISLFANSACQLKDLSVSDAQKFLSESLQRPSSSLELAEMKADAVMSARARLRAARKAQSGKH